MKLFGRWLTAPDVSLLRVGPVAGGYFRYGEVGGVRQRMPATTKPLGDQLILLAFADSGTPRTQQMVATVESDDRLAALFVAAIRGHSFCEFRHVRVSMWTPKRNLPFWFQRKRRTAERRPVTFRFISA